MGHPLTEQEIRMRLKRDVSIRSIDVPKGTVVTPSALEYVKMTGITLNFIEGDAHAAEAEGAKTPGKPSVYYGLKGEVLDVKPEMLTHLYGNQLVEKDNPVIRFRGTLDKLSALILEAQVLGEEKNNPGFVKDLQEILGFVRTLLPAEYKGTLIGEFRVLGLSSRDLRERSHHPEKYFGRKHLLMDYAMGALSVRLNLLRAAVRETELAAVSAFKDENDPAISRRPDIVEALNRLSSLFYILMYKYLPENYSSVGSAGI
jgi:ethanolamine utilization cobalamin adenosyltransferase